MRPRDECLKGHPNGKGWPEERDKGGECRKCARQRIAQWNRDHPERKRAFMRKASDRWRRTNPLQSMLTQLESEAKRRGTR